MTSPLLGLDPANGPLQPADVVALVARTLTSTSFWRDRDVGREREMGREGGGREMLGGLFSRISQLNSAPHVRCVIRCLVPISFRHVAGRLQAGSVRPRHLQHCHAAAGRRAHRSLPQPRGRGGSGIVPVDRAMKPHPTPADCLLIACCHLLSLHSVSPRWPRVW